jgi:hypothetical protein
MASLIAYIPPCTGSGALVSIVSGFRVFLAFFLRDCVVASEIRSFRLASRCIQFVGDADTRQSGLITVERRDAVG